MLSLQPIIMNTPLKGQLNTNTSFGTSIKPFKESIDKFITKNDTMIEEHRKLENRYERGGEEYSREKSREKKNREKYTDMNIQMKEIIKSLEFLEDDKYKNCSIDIDTSDRRTSNGGWAGPSCFELKASLVFNINASPGNSIKKLTIAEDTIEFSNYFSYNFEKSDAVLKFLKENIEKINPEKIESLYKEKRLEAQEALKEYKLKLEEELVEVKQSEEILNTIV